MNYLNHELSYAKQAILDDFDSVLTGKQVVFENGEIGEITAIEKIVRVNKTDTAYDCVADIKMSSGIQSYYVGIALDKGTFKLDNVAEFKQIYSDAKPVARKEAANARKKMQEMFDAIQAERLAKLEEERALAAEERKRKRASTSRKQYIGEEDD